MYGLKFGVGEIIWGSNISSLSLPKPFSLYQLCFQDWTADYLGSMETWSDYLGI